MRMPGGALGRVSIETMRGFIWQRSGKGRGRKLDGDMHWVHLAHSSTPSVDASEGRGEGGFGWKSQVPALVALAFSCLIRHPKTRLTTQVVTESEKC